MARPYKSGKEKSFIISISVPAGMKLFFEQNNISPSKLFQELFYKNMNNSLHKKEIIKKNIKTNNESEILQSLNELKKLYIQKLKPTGNFLLKEKQFNCAVEFILKKYPSLNKANIYSFVERESGYFYLAQSKDKN